MAGLRLALLSRRFWPGMGSAETITSQLTCGLADRDCQVTVLTAKRLPSWPTRIDYHGFPVVRVGPTPDGFWRRRHFVAAIKRWLNEHIKEIDLVYVLGMQEDAAAAVGAVDGRLPVALAPLRSGRYGDCCRQVAQNNRRAVKRACLQADAFIAYSPAVRRELEAAGYSRDRIHDGCLGIGPVDLAEGEVHSAKTQSLARGDLADASGILFLPSNAKLVVCTTRTLGDSGWQTLLDSWHSVLKFHTTAKLWFVGEPANRAAIMGRISQLQLEGRVQIIGALDSVEAVLAAADLLVAPSPHGSHMAILESMAAGLPTVAAETTVNRWLLDDIQSSESATGVAGLLFPPGNSRLLADAILAILNSPDLAVKLCAAAWHRASRDFSLAKMLDDHLTWFETLLASKTGYPT